MRASLFLPLTLILALTTLGASLHKARAQDQSDLSGTWQLNEELSDDPARVMGHSRGKTDPDAAMGGRGGRGGRKGGGMGGGGMGGRSGGRQPDAGNAEEMLRARQRHARLEIFHEGLEMNVTDGLDVSRLYHTDGRLMEIWTERGQVQATAAWDGPALVIRWQGGRGGAARVRRLELDQEGRQLIVTEERQLPRQDRTIKLRLVYDRVG